MQLRNITQRTMNKQKMSVLLYTIASEQEFSTLQKGYSAAIIYYVQLEFREDSTQCHLFLSHTHTHTHSLWTWATCINRSDLTFPELLIRHYKTITVPHQHSGHLSCSNMEHTTIQCEVCVVFRHYPPLNKSDWTPSRLTHWCCFIPVFTLYILKTIELF